MKKIYRVAGYVKLAKLWERNRNAALELHHQNFREKYADNDKRDLLDVYVDITGHKQLVKRPEMIRLIRDCSRKRIDLIDTPTRAYLAANAGEFCYLIKYLFSLPNRIDIVTDDTNYHIDTIQNEDDQRNALFLMAEKYVSLNSSDYDHWEEEIISAMRALDCEESDG